MKIAESEVTAEIEEGIVPSGICHLQDPIDDVYLELENEETEWVLAMRTKNVSNQVSPSLC